MAIDPTDPILKKPKHRAGLCNITVEAWIDDLQTAGVDLDLFDIIYLFPSFLIFDNFWILIWFLMI